MKKFLYLSLILIAVSSLIYSCQETEEPTEVNNEMELEIDVVNQNDKLISGSSVFWSLTNNDELPNENWNQMNGSGGSFEQILNLPLMIDNSKLAIEVNPPANSSYQPAGPLTDIITYCSSTYLKYVFYEVEEINCSNQITCSLIDEMSFVYNLDDTNNDNVLSTRLFTNTCPNPLTLSLSFNNLTSFSIYVVIDGNRNLYLNPVAIPANSNFRVEIEYNPIAVESGVDLVNILVQDNTGSEVMNCDQVINYEAFQSFECACPNSSTVSFPSQGELTLCLGMESQIFTVDISKIKNPNEDCSIILTPIFNNGEFFENDGGNLNAVSLDGVNFRANAIELAPGESLNEMAIEIEANTSGTYSAVAQFSVQTLDKDGNPDNQVCDNMFLNVNFKIDGGLCDLDLTTDIPNNLYASPSSTISGCVERISPENKYIYLNNLSTNCEMKVTVEISNVQALDAQGNTRNISANDQLFLFNLANISPNGVSVSSVGTSSIELIIPPDLNEVVRIPVQFYPRSSQVWPNGRNGVEYVNFSCDIETRFDDIIIDANNPDCSRTERLFGFIDLNACCQELPPLILTEWSANQVLDPNDNQTILASNNGINLEINGDNPVLRIEKANQGDLPENFYAVFVQQNTLSLDNGNPDLSSCSISGDGSISYQPLCNLKGNAGSNLSDDCGIAQQIGSACEFLDYNLPNIDYEGNFTPLDAANPITNVREGDLFLVRMNFFRNDGSFYGEIYGFMYVNQFVLDRSVTTDQETIQLKFAFPI